MMLSVSLLSAAVVIGLGYLVGVQSITDEVYQRLASVRNAKTYEVESYFGGLANVTKSLARGQIAADAVRDFSQGFRAIEAVDTIDCSRDLTLFYEEFVDSLASNLEVRRETDAFYPRNVAGCYLQYHYMVRNPYGSGEKNALVDPRDGSAYTAAHRRYHDYFNQLLLDYELYDVFLIDAVTEDIVYTAFKEADFGTSLAAGPYRNSNLAELVRKVKRNIDLNEPQLVDFAPYRPSYGSPAAFIGAPIIVDEQLVGIIALQFPVDRINAIMNYEEAWAENGLGETGEVLLVGEDGRLRSNPRSYLVAPDRFVKEMSEVAMSEQDRRILTQVGPILSIEIRSANVEEAILGRQGVRESVGYHGEPVLSAYGPLRLPGDLHWSLLAEIDRREALAPVTRFQRLNLSALAFVIALVTILAMLFTRWLVRPIDRLTQGAQAVSAGNTSVRVEKTTDDELGQLTEVFNGMVASIEQQKAEIADQARKTDELLYDRFPAAIAERYRNGETDIVDHFEGVAVLSCDLRGANYLDDREPNDRWAIVQDISERFSRAADKLGMETVYPVPDGYLTVCGMNVPRLDNGRRIVILAMELHEAVAAINQKYDLSFTLHVGTAHGPVMAGVLNDEGQHYVIWGPTVDEAQRLSAEAGAAVTLSTNPLMELLTGNFAYRDTRAVAISTGRNIQAGILVGRVNQNQAV